MIFSRCSAPLRGSPQHIAIRLLHFVGEAAQGELAAPDGEGSARRPPKLDLDVYPYLPRATVRTTSAKAYMTLLEGAAP